MHDRSISNFPSCWIQWTALWSAGAFKCNNLAVNFQKTSVNETSLNPARNRSRQEPVLESAENDEWSTLFILVQIFLRVYFGTDMKWIRCSFAYIMGEAVDINTVISCILMSWWCSELSAGYCLTAFTVSGSQRQSAVTGDPIWWLFCHITKCTYCVPVCEHLKSAWNQNWPHLLS